MSKQDRTYTRTASDLERKYNFGQSFAEIYGLATDAQKDAENANEAIAGLDAKLDSDEIFNRLTNFGAKQGIYRGDAGEIYINANYIKSGKLAADYIDADNLKVKAANITGTLSADRIAANSITSDKIAANSITTGKLAASLELTAPIIKGGMYYGNLFNVYPEVNANGGYVANTTGGMSIYGYFGSALYHMFQIYYQDAFTDPRVYLRSPVGASLHIGGYDPNGLAAYTYFNGKIDFSGATVSGLSSAATFA